MCSSERNGRDAPSAIIPALAPEWGSSTQSRRSAPRDIGRPWPICEFTDGACQDEASALNTGGCTELVQCCQAIGNIGDGAAAEGLGALLFCDRHGSAERRAHRSIAAALGADHRGSDAVQFGIPPGDAAVCGDRKSTIDGDPCIRNLLEPQQCLRLETQVMGVPASRRLALIIFVAYLYAIRRLRHRRGTR